MKTIALYYYKSEFEGMRSTIYTDIALAHYLNALQGDDIKIMNDWADLLRGRQREDLQNYGLANPLGSRNGK